MKNEVEKKQKNTTSASQHASVVRVRGQAKVDGLRVQTSTRAGYSVFSGMW